MTRIYLGSLIILSLFSFSKAFSQDIKPEVVNLVPTSPNAASLARFGQFPVGYFTGLPEISIPLFEASSGKLKVPITLSYHASGVQVENIASWVGLGWALNTGGIITRQVRGIEDEGVNGYFHPIFKASQLADYSNATDPHTPENNFLRETGKGRGDTQADVFYFTMEGLSGKFIYNQEDQVFYTIPRQNIKIEAVDDGRTGFKIIPPSGNIYNFDVLEKTAVSSICNPAVAGSKNITSAWYLSKIVSFDKKDTVSFSYETRNLSYETLGSEIRSFLTGYSGGGGGIGPGLQDSYCTQQNNISEKKLTKISFRGGTISFNAATTNRCDLLNAAALNNVELKNADGKALRKWQFSYSYFSPTVVVTNCTDYVQSLSYRLKLDSLKEISSFNEPGLSKKPYIFIYKDEHSLPSRMSKAQDYWGFYNGKTANTTLLPSYAIQAWDKLTLFEGGDRDVDSIYTAIGSMTKISYPTGGSTEFAYENNRIVDSTLSVRPLSRNVVLDTVGSQPARPRFEKTFTINEPPSELNNWNGGAFVTLKFGSPGCVIDPKVGATTCAQFILTGVDNTSISTGVLLSTVTNYYPNGTYKLAATFNQSPPNYYDFYFTASWYYQDTVYKTMRFTGGLRLKNMVDYNGINHKNNLITRFNYSRENNSLLSSGSITGFPLVNNFMQKGYLDRYYSGSLYWDRVVTKISSYSNQLLTQTAGAYTTYGFVTAFKGANGEGGKTTYKFLQTPDILSQVYPYVSFSNDWKRGQLLEQTDYRGNNGKYFPVNKVKNTYGYNLISPKYSVSLKTYFARQTNVGTGDENTFSIPYSDQYTDESNWIGLLKSSVQTYDSSDTTKNVTATNEFTYSPTHFGLITKKHIESNGSVNIVNYKYPQDYIGITKSNKLSNAVRFLQINNVSSTIIEVINQKMNSLGNMSTVAAQYNSFKDNNAVLDTIWLADIKEGTDLFVPSSVSTGSIEKSLLYYPKVSYDQYSPYNNLLQQSLIGGAKSSYIWSYNNQYPIAEIRNSSYAAIESALGGSTKVNAFATKPNPSKTEIAAFLSPIRNSTTILKDGQITSYSYDPSVGITSVTDAKGMTTYYEYDALQRLKNIKDQDNNIVKYFNYHYAGQNDNEGGASISYYSISVSKTFTKNNCGTGGSPGTYTYSVAAGTYSSTISQADANIKAQNAINANGQAAANTNAVCIYYNVVLSKIFTKNNCSTGGSPGTYTYSIAAGTYSSTVSQADANTKAQNAINANGQAAANTNAVCTYYNVVLSKIFTKNNCSTGGSPGTYTYSIAAGTYSSTVSQADANTKAQNAINANGQAAANTNAVCTYYNVVLSKIFTKNNCSTGGSPGTYTYSIAAGTYSSIVSQADANIKAQNAINANGQAAANTNVVCTYYNVALNQIFTKNDCKSPGVPGTYTYNVAARSYSSTISQADANGKAQNVINTNGQAAANASAVCTYYNVAISKTIIKNNCAVGGTPGSYNYVVAAATYSSTVSLADANSQAHYEIESLGQNEANVKAGCTFSSIQMNQVFTRNNCVGAATGSSYNYIVTAGKYVSTLNQAAANSQASADLTTNGQAVANINASCDCVGQMNRTINGVCETGNKVTTRSVYNAQGKYYTCTYHYVWSNGTRSGDFSEQSTSQCGLDQ